MDYRTSLDALEKSKIAIPGVNRILILHSCSPCCLITILTPTINKQKGNKEDSI
jgi:hypothetical protein